MSKFLFILMLVCGSGAYVNAQTPLKENDTVKSSGVTESKHRVVYQVSTKDTAELTGVMNNLRHLKEGWKDSVEIEVVVHGPGLDLLIAEKTKKANAIAALMNQGVVFVACHNTMKQRGIVQDQLLQKVKIVPMGVGEIVMKQEMGWSYLKGGF